MFRYCRMEGLGDNSRFCDNLISSTTVALAADRRKKSKGPGLKVLQIRAFTRGVFHVSRVPAFPPFLVSYLADTIRGYWYVNESSSALAACSGLGMWRGG